MAPFAGTRGHSRAPSWETRAQVGRRAVLLAQIRATKSQSDPCLHVLPPRAGAYGSRVTLASGAIMGLGGPDKARQRTDCETSAVDDQRFGFAVRAVRIKRGWRQADLAVRAGVSAATISRIERGHLDTLSLAIVRRVAVALDIRVDLVARWRAGELDRLLNAKHAALHEQVARMFRGRHGSSNQRSRSPSTPSAASSTSSPGIPLGERSWSSS